MKISGLGAWGRLALTFALGAGISAPAHAEGEEALASCRLLQDSDSAAACYRALLADAPDPELAAEVHWALGERAEANRLFRRALELEPDNVAVRLRWAELYRETHQPNEALRLVREIHARDEDSYAARLLEARILLDAGESAGVERALALVERFPSRPEAKLLLARLALEEGEPERARGLLEETRGVRESCTPASVESFALQAALERLEATSDSPLDGPWEQGALACGPRSGQVFELQAQLMVMARRYREAVALLERAVDVEPARWSAHTELAMQLMRIDRNREAREHLQIAYSGDPFDPGVVNLLRLFDQLDDFRSLPRARAGENTWLELRLHPSEAELLAGYAERLAADAVRSFEAKYGHSMHEPIVVEMYPDHDDFAVRTAGLPGLGILGATFGNVVAMDSPSARGQDEDFLWGSVLWHELAHVFTLEASEHRVARWFSEGISVYEEWTSGPTPQRALPIAFVEALAADRLLSITELDRGFQQPRWPGQVAVSYVQAGLVCEYIATQFGADRFAKILAGYRAGEDERELLPRVLGVSMERLDRDSLAFARKRAGALLRGLERWREADRAAQQALQSADWRALLEHASELAALHPMDPSLRGAAALRIAAHRGLNQPDALLDALIEYREIGGAAPEHLRALVRELGARGRGPEALSVLEAARFVVPFEEWLHAELGQAYADAGRPRAALAELELWEALDPLDRVGVHYALARTYTELNQTELARQHVLYALEVAPEFRPGLALLLELRR